MEVQFTAMQASETLKPKVTTKFLGFSIPYDLPAEQQNACDHLTDTRCPLDEGEDATYVLTMPVLKAYPSIDIQIQLELLADGDESQFCFKLDCKVVDG